MPKSIRDLKRCPFCGEWIKARSHRCHHCKRWIEKLRPFSLDIGTGVLRSEHLVLADHLWDTSLVCHRCRHHNANSATKCSHCRVEFYVTPTEGPPWWVIAWETVRSLPDLLGFVECECPFCAEPIAREAQICKHCNVEIPPEIR